MSAFIPTRHKNPCQICGNVDGRCRQTETIHLCMNGTDGNAPPGFRFLGLSSDNQWGKFVEGQQSPEWTEELRQQWKEQQQREREQREQEEAARQLASFSPEKRDRYYRKLLSQLSLSPIDRKDLERRDLNDDQIKVIGCKSVEKWQQLENSLPTGLPGVSIDGKSLNIPSAGYLIPIYDVDQKLVGFQYRLRDASQGGRYRWITSKTNKRPNGPTSHLPNGELPITVARPIGDVKLKSIGMAEGILKPIITAQKLGQVIIGAAGGQFAGSPEELKRSLKKLSEELGTKTVDFYPDAGAVENQTVMLQYHKTFSLLEEWGYQVQVAWWEQLTKESPDIDELELPTQIQFITVDELINLALERGYRPINNESRKATKLPQYGLTYAPDLVVNQRYLDITIPDIAGVVCLRSGKGTGKTELIARIVYQWLQLGKRVILLSHRIQLTQSLCDRVGIHSIYEIKAGKAGYGQYNDSKILAALQGFGLCVDSLHPNSQAQFKAKEWDDCLVIVDEAEQVFWHALNSDTCKKDRVPILQELRELLTNNTVILSDADLSDISIDLVLKIKNQPDLKPWICLNTYKGSGYNSFFYSDEEDWLLKLEQAIRAGEKVLIIEDSQKRKGMYSTSNLERRFKKQFPDKRILRIDSQTMELKDHPAYGCMNRLNSLLLEYDIVICSPSVETGVSIDIKGHFTSVWGFFCGCIPENSARQALARVREPVDRHICANSHGLGKIATGETDAKALEGSQNALVAIKLRQIFDAARGDQGTDYNFMDAGMQAWAKIAARINTGMIQYAASIKAGLEAEGHTVSDYDGNDGEFDQLQTKAISEAMKQNRNDHQWEHGKALADAPLITKEEAKKLEESRSKANAEEQIKLEKYKLTERYCQEVTPELYLRDCERWHPRIQLHYYLTIGRKHVKERDRSNRDALTNNGQAWIPDLNRVLISDKVAMLERYRILELLKKPEFRNDDPDLIALQQQAIAEAHSIKRCLGVTLTKPDEAKKRKGDTPIQVLGKLINLIGLELTCIRKEGKRKQQVRVYAVLTMEMAMERAAKAGKGCAEWSFFTPDDGREEVFSTWLTRDDERQRQREAKQITSSVVQPTESVLYHSDTVVTTGNKYIYTDRDYQTVTTNLVTTENTSPLELVNSMGDGVVAEVAPEVKQSNPVEQVWQQSPALPPAVPPVSIGQRFKRRGETLVVKSIDAASIWVKRIGETFEYLAFQIPISELGTLEAIG